MSSTRKVARLNPGGLLGRLRPRGDLGNRRSARRMRSPKTLDRGHASGRRSPAGRQRWPAGRRHVVRRQDEGRPVVTIPVAQAPVSHDLGARLVLSRPQARSPRGKTRIRRLFPYSLAKLPAPGGMSRIGKIRKGPFLILPMRTTPPSGPRGPGGRGARSPRVRRARRVIFAFSPLIDPEAERATGRKGMVVWGLSSPRRASLRTAAGDPTVKESLSSLFVLPRAGIAGAAAAAGALAGSAAGRRSRVRAA